MTHCIQKVNGMENEKRGRVQAVHDRLNQVLNGMQLLGLRQVENFGWYLLFVRRTLFQEPVAVLSDAQGSRIGLLEQDGQVTMDPNIPLRKQV